MKLVVTGAAGFIGGHVLNSLRCRDLEVTAVVKDKNRLSDVKGLQVVELDIGSSAKDAFNRLGSPDVLIHLAWGGLPNYKSLHHFETETPLHYRFLKAMVEAGLSSLVCAGTCFEYGMQSGLLSEDLPTMPNNPYGHAKDTLRRSLQFLKAVHSFKFTWARLFYMYGEGQSGTALYPQIRKAVKRGDSVFNMSGGEQLRDYLPVETLADYIADLASINSDAGIVNVCSGHPISVRSLVEGWLRDYGWQIKLNLGYYPYLDYEPMAFWGDRRRLDDVLGR